MVFNLNRAYTFENLDVIPYSVLVAIVRTCGKNINVGVAKKKKEDVVQFIRSYRREISNDFSELTKDDYLNITSFVGGDGRWTRDSVTRALKNVVQFNRKPKIDFNNFHVGYKDSRNLENYDIIMIYKFCLEYRIRVGMDDELEDLLQRTIEYNEHKNEDLERKMREQEQAKLRIEEKQESLEREMREQASNERANRIQEAHAREQEARIQEAHAKEKEDWKQETGFSDLKEKSKLMEELVEKMKTEKEELVEKMSELKQKCVNQEQEIKTMNGELVEFENFKTQNKLQKDQLESVNNDLKKLKESGESGESGESDEFSKPVENLNLKDLKLRLFNNFDQFSKENLEKIALVLHHNEPNKTTVNDSFKITDINLNFIVSRSVLASKEAIIFAIKVFTFDLRMSKDPARHILELNKSSLTESVFEPGSLGGDDYFCNYLKLNKDIFSMDQYWIPELEDLYSSKAENALIINQNVDNFEELKNIYKTNNFHRGWIPSSLEEKIDEQKTFHEGLLIKDIKKNDIFSFGVPYKKVVYFQPKEYIDFLSKKSYPASPFDSPEDTLLKRELEKKHIDRLRDIGKDYPGYSDYAYLISSLERKRKNDTPKRIKEAKEAKKKETEAKEAKDGTKNIEMKFLNQYLYKADKYDVIIAELFKLGLYIRGWRLKGNNDFPIMKENILSYKDHQDDINENILKTVSRLQELKNEVFDILPVVVYEKDKKTFNYEKDLIWDIVDQLKEIKSVVFLDLMTKSSKLLSSVHHYNNLATKKKLFDIDMMC